MYYMSALKVVRRTAFKHLHGIPYEVIAFLDKAIENQDQHYTRAFRGTWDPTVHFIRFAMPDGKVVNGGLMEAIESLMEDTRAPDFKVDATSKKSVDAFQHLLILLCDLTNPFHSHPVSQEYSDAVSGTFSRDVKEALSYNLIPFPYELRKEAFIPKVSKMIFAQHVASMEGYKRMLLPAYVNGNGYPCCKPTIHDWFVDSFTLVTNILMGVLYEASNMEWGS